MSLGSNCDYCTAKLLCCFKPQFSHLWNEDDNMNFPRHIHTWSKELLVKSRRREWHRGRTNKIHVFHRWEQRVKERRPKEIIVCAYYCWNFLNGNSLRKGGNVHTVSGREGRAGEPGQASSTDGPQRPCSHPLGLGPNEQVNTCEFPKVIHFFC